MKAMKPVFSSPVSRREFLGQAALSVSALALAAGCADSGGRAGRKIPVGVQLYSVREQCKQDLPGTLAAIAQGLASKLIERAADVVLKEGRQLILVPRETPLSAIHLENMLRLVRAGAVILPPNPGFYHHPQRVADLVDFVVARILDQLHVRHSLMPRWGEAEGVSPVDAR